MIEYLITKNLAVNSLLESMVSHKEFTAVLRNYSLLSCLYQCESRRLEMSEQCPADEDLAAFVDGAVWPEERTFIELHLSRCAKCREIVVFVSRTKIRTWSTNKIASIACSLTSSGTYKLGSQNPADSVTWGTNRVFLSQPVTRFVAVNDG